MNPEQDAESRRRFLAYMLHPHRREPDRGPVPSEAQLLAWRREAGLTQWTVSARAGCSKSLVQRAERGPTSATRPAGAATKRRIAVALGHPDPSEWGDRAGGADDEEDEEDEEDEGDGGR